MRMLKKKKKKEGLRGLSILDLVEGFLSTLVLPSVSHTNPCSSLSQATKDKGQQSK
jgi:hypothetical protein